MSNNRILIADDEPDFTEIIGAVAEDIGFDITVVHEGSEVVSRVSAVDPAVIVLDLRMPGADGVEILKQLADIGCTAQIILISGLGQSTLNSVELVGKDKNLNVAGSLSKPMTPDAIEAALIPHLTKQETASSISASEQKRVPTIFGLQTEFLPHSVLTKDLETFKRAKLEGSWVFDNKEVVIAEEFRQWAQENNLSLGLIDLILRDAQYQFSVLGNNLQQLELSMHLDTEILLRENIADHLSEVIGMSNFPLERFVLEVDEKDMHLHQASAAEVLSRLRIKGFRIAIVTDSNGDELLAMIDKLPMDEIIVNMVRFNSGDQLDGDMELEFAYSSFISVANRKGIKTCAQNVDSYTLLEFVKRCKFQLARGSALGTSEPITKLAEFFS